MRNGLIKKDEIMEKKLVFVTRNMLAGGAERVIAQLVNYFSNEKINCIIITINDSDIFYELDPRVEVKSIGEKSKNKILDRILRYAKLRNIIMKIQPDAVLAMPEEIAVYVLLGMLGTRIPVFVSERNNPWLMPDKKITRILRKLMYPFATGFIFQTEMAKSFFSKKIQQRGTVICNPVELSRIPDQFQGDRLKVIVSAGRLEKQKNFEMLIKAFSIFIKGHPDYILRIYGEGTMRDTLQNQILDLGLFDKVELPGRKSNLLELMNPCSMFVLPSNYEGMPNVLLEAMCMGMPVISTDCPSGGPREVINNDVNGLLINVGDINGLVQAMIKMTDIDFSNSLANKAYLLRNELGNKKIFESWKNYIFKE